MKFEISMWFFLNLEKGQTFRQQYKQRLTRGANIIDKPEPLQKENWKKEQIPNGHFIPTSPDSNLKSCWKLTFGEKRNKFYITLKLSNIMQSPERSTSNCCLENDWNPKVCKFPPKSNFNISFCTKQGESFRVTGELTACSCNTMRERIQTHIVAIVHLTKSITYVLDNLVNTYITVLISNNCRKISNKKWPQTFGNVGSVLSFLALDSRCR